MAGLLAARGVRARRPRRARGAERAGVRAALLRHPAPRRGGGADGPAARGARDRRTTSRTPERDARSWPGRPCRRAATGGARGGRRGPRARARGAPAPAGDAPASTGSSRGRRGHRSDPLHLGDDRTAQGCRAHARQPAAQLRGRGQRPAAARPPRTSSSAGCPCSTPSGRPPASTPRSGPAPAWPCSPASTATRPSRTLQDQRVTVMEGVPAMYAAMLHHPRPRRLRPVPVCGWASPVAPRCRSRCSSGSRRPSTAWCSRATGFRDIAGRELQPP